MRKNFSLLRNLEENVDAINSIDDCVKITLGPSGKNGIISTKIDPIKFITTGSTLMKSLEFENNSANIIRQLIDQAAEKTFAISGDGSTTTILMCCQLLKTSLKFLLNGYNPVFLSNGMKKLSHFQNFTFPYVFDESQSVAKAYDAICTPDFFGFNKDLGLQYRGRFDSTGRGDKPPVNNQRDLYEAMKLISSTQKGPKNQFSSIGCSLKWKEVN